MNLKLTPEVLYRVCQPCSFKNPTENLRLIHHLLTLMRHERGIGLAANQAGLDRRLFVMLINDELYSCFNPEIISSSQDLVEYNEGCLSFPGERIMITRPKTIQVAYYNAHGKHQQAELTGLVARCFQHELDHLNGITMHERQENSHGQTLFMGS